MNSKLKGFLDGLKKANDEIKKISMEKPVKWPPEKTGARREWIAYGLRCCTVMGATGICGYVRVPDSHSVAKMDYDDVAVKVHGGLTFRRRDDDGGHWFGFDTGHVDDGAHPESKGYGVMGDAFGPNYWNDNHVEMETEYLAQQLADLK